MSDPNNIALMEHLALRSSLSLRAFCAKFRSALRLPAFRFDSEDATEWGLTELGDVEYNISRPYRTDTLRKWDSTVPPGCNVGISLILLRGHMHPTHEWAEEHLVIPVGRAIANEFSATVHHHRTWLGVGQNVVRNTLFAPNAA